MERESFESEEIAQILNEKFVSVKVDREERPDVDKVYMTYIQVIIRFFGRKEDEIFLLLTNTYRCTGDSVALSSGYPGFKTSSDHS